MWGGIFTLLKLEEGEGSANLLGTPQGHQI